MGEPGSVTITTRPAGSMPAASKALTKARRCESVSTVEPDLEETTIAVRSMMYLALSYDHRIVDGADAARFLGTMKARLEEGNFEADLGL